jgi:hypothetical protein
MCIADAGASRLTVRWVRHGDVHRGRVLPRQVAGRCRSPGRQGHLDVLPKFEDERLEYVYHNVEFAQTLTKVFHMVPEPLATIRDWVFDKTPLVGYFLNKGYLEKARIETGQMPELYPKKNVV